MKNGIIIKSILAEYKYNRELAERNADSLLQTVLNNEDYNILQKEISSLRFLIAEKKIKNIETQEAERKLKSLLNKEKKLLKSLGYTSDSFKPKYNCTVCNDTGYVNGNFCQCLQKQYYRELLQIWDLEALPSFTFKDCNLADIKNEKQQACLKTLYATFEKYCKKYPNINKKNALIMGGTGVGKSCLMSAVYNGLLNRGFNPIFLTAIQLNKLMLNYHLEPVATRNIYMSDLIDCDMLLIDDLGTEQILKNVTIEYLLQILNTREQLNKPVFLSTNLNKEQLKNFYGERVFSRMANFQTTTIKAIIGDDIRLS